MKNPDNAEHGGRATAEPDPAALPRRRSTGIEWTEHTWNPFVGCSIHSAGCTNCYAMALAARIAAFGTTPTYDGTTKRANGKPVWTGQINRASPATWRKPLSVKTPSMFFVNSMSDFFHAAVPDEWRVEALRVMRATPQHQYQVLTKRPENIGPFLERAGADLPVNAWLGATVERADVRERIDVLRAIPARIRFLSLEPLLGPLEQLALGGIHWVIVGGESGPGARPMRAEWVRAIRDQGMTACVPLFVKQYGAAHNNPIYHELPDHRSPYTGARRVAELDPHGRGGALVDGMLWREFPRARRA